MSDRNIALITGANKGIGREIARQLGARGAVVLIGARDETRGEEAASALRAEGVDAHCVALDVTSIATIEAAAQRIAAEWGKLDILVNNAAVFIDNGPPSELDPALLRRTYDTNVFGVVDTIRTLLPLLRKSPAGRIVNLSSGLGSLTQQLDPESSYYGVNLLAYNSSKTAVNAITVAFAKELRDTPIKVNAADPGYVATDLNQHQGYRTVEQGATAPVRLATLPVDGPTGGYFDENGPLPW
ncbi:MAG TPA: SDR family oxidoreductase [Armatimonadota bacterium]|nr:SDR family oxidoreductase [Armatimonadota bacterium]